jgi:hypothetical protein
VSGPETPEAAASRHTGSLGADPHQPGLKRATENGLQLLLQVVVIELRTVVVSFV